MKQIISYSMKKMAEFIIFAEGLDFEKLNHIVEVLKDVLENEKNFDPKGENALTFSKKGLNIIKSLSPSLAAPHLPGVIKRIDAAINVSNDPKLKDLNMYLRRTLRRTPGKWVNLNIRGNDFEKNKEQIINEALKPFTNALNALSSIKKPMYVEPLKEKGLTHEEHKDIQEQLKKRTYPYEEEGIVTPTLS